MGCNCGKTAQQKFSFVFVDEKGKRTPYTSEVQAQAAKIRNGQKGTVERVPA